MYEYELNVRGPRGIVTVRLATKSSGYLFLELDGADVTEHKSYAKTPEGLSAAAGDAAHCLEAYPTARQVEELGSLFAGMFGVAIAGGAA